ncbi:DUF1015 family protein [Nocardioides sp. LHG3406-4]|uniref:DUF1015 family protein n=1 Tax=Nocardioides sp. LHG3406-4 TaxID=2804575 RepID=UPI003CF2CA02
MDSDGQPDAEVVTPPSPAKPLRLHPFRALRLNGDRVGDPSSARAFARPYRAVAGRLVEWERQGHIEHDGPSAVYLHEYTSGGMTVRGLVGALDLSSRATGHDDRALLPHEGIHVRQADELAERMHEMGMNPAPILLVHRGPASVRALVHRLIDLAPDHVYSDRVGQRHRLWAVTDPADLAVVDTGLANSTLLIADGHHRYAAYLRLQEREPGTPWDRGLAMVVDQEDTPLHLGAIHRVLPGLSLDDVDAAANQAGMSSRVAEADDALASLTPSTVLASDGIHWRVLDLPELIGRAAVELVHDDLLPRLPLTSPAHYHHSVEEALDAVGTCTGEGVALILPAPAFDQVGRILMQDRLLPEKATSFQPKPSVGVLMRSLHDE